jgi:hypothetical protein
VAATTTTVLCSVLIKSIFSHLFIGEKNFTRSGFVVKLKLKGFSKMI